MSEIGINLGIPTSSYFPPFPLGYENVPIVHATLHVNGGVMATSESSPMRAEIEETLVPFDVV